MILQKNNAIYMWTNKYYIKINIHIHTHINVDIDICKAHKK